MHYQKLNEGSYWGTPTEATRELVDAFNTTDAGRDLYALGVRMVLERSRIKYERRGQGMSMPRTAAYKNTDTGKFHIEHYSSKPGLEVYGEKDFDTPEELYRHMWMRVAKNLIPASLISKREAEKRINLEEIFPLGHGVSQTEFFNRIMPLIGDPNLIHPSNSDLLATPTVQELLKLGLIGKRDRFSGNNTPIIVTDISKNQIIKYYFYCTAASVVKTLYSDLIIKIVGEYKFSGCLGTISAGNTMGHESWTVTNTNRLPNNSVNFRTGENTLKCHVQDNDMMAAVFLAIIKRTFKRAKTSTKWDEKLIVHPGSDPIITELNGILSDYFFMTASNLEPSIFFEVEHLENDAIVYNAHALLIKYLLKNGSPQLREAITSKEELQELVEYTTTTEDLDTNARELIELFKSLKYV